MMGRHREFNIDDALDAAVKVFWEKGYEGTSYDDLTRATGVKRPGLYASFGNKEALFQKVLERYTQRYLRHMTDALSEPTSRKMAEHVLYGTARMATSDPMHRGCLGINGALACSTDAEPIREMLIRCRAQGEAALRQRLEQYQKDGDLPESADCAALAAYLVTVNYGISVQAKAGVSQPQLLAVVEQALAGWPLAPDEN
ncbi:TetR/AcrR family transcriptional regulator [Enterobacteriaceae bacterium H20N1]|uniref:TetR/AcrR family transcriptional regulator n=1 Tax=Dryocola boscaweniae TaxID=2925397 RepID=A0A9X2WBS6_9ENTR|nr:TetR/AcrR family transcriptional regulator [Dryocola boscaweniae]MCT4703199.1 TetR/AcrR family transcriptional regulator [Dryocola boscaweniae]MCT4720367.1 TetR/AcrR family transcriptional regulator [Dryocola boscaweniae]